MTHVVNSNTYRDLPFSLETPHDDFYTYTDLKDLVSKSELYKEDLIKCRTVGILLSVYGKYFLTDLDNPNIASTERHIRVSVVNMKRPLPSTVVPYPVQIFGTLQWKNRPVIFATIVQMLNPATAVRLRNTLNGVADIHLANSDYLLEIPDSQLEAT